MLKWTWNIDNENENAKEGELIFDGIDDNRIKVLKYGNGDYRIFKEEDLKGILKDYPQLNSNGHISVKDLKELPYLELQCEYEEYYNKELCIKWHRIVDFMYDYLDEPEMQETLWEDDDISTSFKDIEKHAKEFIVMITINAMIYEAKRLEKEEELNIEWDEIGNI